MSYRVLITAAIAATLSLGALSAFAQPKEKRGSVVVIPSNQYDRHADRNDRRDARRDHKQDSRDYRRDRRNDHRADRRNDRRDYRQDNRYRYENQRRPSVYYYNARGPNFRRGHHLPHELRNRQYVVTDYRGHRLSAPPRGQQWVQVGGDYVLVAIATGIIASIILSH